MIFPSIVEKFIYFDYTIKCPASATGKFPGNGVFSMTDLKTLGRLTLALALSAALLSGCADDTVTHTAVIHAVTTQAPPAQETSAPAESGVPDSPTYTDAGSDDRTTAGETLLDEDGTYSSAQDVALYLHTYGELPDNFITKAEARDLGWSGGGLDDYLEDACIGGDTFGNREGLLPEGKYHECDIDTLNAHSRGAKRLVWDEDGNIYYTADHYESFELLYEGS